MNLAARNHQLLNCPQILTSLSLIIGFKPRRYGRLSTELWSWDNEDYLRAHKATLLVLQQTANTHYVYIWPISKHIKTNVCHHYKLKILMSFKHLLPQYFCYITSMLTKCWQGVIGLPTQYSLPKIWLYGRCQQVPSLRSSGCSIDGSECLTTTDTLTVDEDCCTVVFKVDSWSWQLIMHLYVWSELLVMPTRVSYTALPYDIGYVVLNVLSINQVRLGSCWFICCDGWYHACVANICYNT